ncbi:yippee-like protein, putative [Eimeria necatrix]|uniref:Protein yippee-like n=1 Tax=Eimeria necatrix TaxID=51315 RepID=U6MIQ7_9EIME|nr:yippee-like protein, putative [Eimeria necatrix]CDJ64102.1 yippee-like protein, putative [Eimeria necatrix]
MGRLFKEWLTCHKVYICRQCHSHLAARSQLASRQFRGRTGPAWLFNRASNVSEGQCEDRVMTTGKHTIVDIYCNDCGTNVGWRYRFAVQDSQKYKEGKYILEKALLLAEIQAPNGALRRGSMEASDAEAD